jgi:hypothetical protein
MACRTPAVAVWLAAAAAASLQWQTTVLHWQRQQELLLLDHHLLDHHLLLLLLLAHLDLLDGGLLLYSTPLLISTRCTQVCSLHSHSGSSSSSNSRSRRQLGLCTMVSLRSWLQQRGAQLLRMHLRVSTAEWLSTAAAAAVVRHRDLTQQQQQQLLQGCHQHLRCRVAAFSLPATVLLLLLVVVLPRFLQIIWQIQIINITLLAKATTM